MNDIKTFLISPHVLAQEVGEEIVLLDLNSDTYFGLDATGSRIWRLVKEGKDLDEICEALFNEYDASREDLERDTALLTQELIACGLLRQA
jgi:hypothetical protein